MADRFFIPSISKLFRWITQEYKNSGSIFGIGSELLFKSGKQDPFRIERYGQLLETPLGTAAGPHTQLAQNIISGWLVGARYIELKTVQTLDDIVVTKPCIHMEDEGYNCEWSQELTLNESFDQYLNAWILIHFLREKFGWQKENTSGSGFIFNMSVGYDLKGILSRNIQDFLDKMENCRAEKEEKIEQLSRIHPEIKDISIPDRISNNVTFSTMHGCPAGEIEDIARYLVQDRGFHTTIKLNPTLLGEKSVREILNNKLGYTITVPDEAFAHDLKYEDALKIIDNLRGLQANPQFGLKLTNTLETLNLRNIFSNKEKVLYMSGRALHPIAINLAARLQEDFKGELDISFCAGADCFNISHVLNCGLFPVTVCSDILKPGGYTRLSQFIKKIDRVIGENASGGQKPFCKKVSGLPKTLVKGSTEAHQAYLNNLKQYAREVINDKGYHKSFFGDHSIKTARELKFFDCISAPCSFTCPAHQDVPRYMYHTARGEFEKAFEVIVETNPFPTVTGMVCDHQCMTKCTRINYDNPLQIREIKRFVADHHERAISSGNYEIKQKFCGGTGGIVHKSKWAIRVNAPRSSSLETNTKEPPGRRRQVVVIGAGPSGLSCAYYLSRRGFQVNVYETRTFPGGMAAFAIPEFRLRAADIEQDIRRIEDSGVKIHYNTRIDREAFNRLKTETDFIYIGVGAQGRTRLNIPGEDLENVGDALSFLSAVRRGEKTTCGKRVAVIGGGNSAIDAARTAWRLTGETSEVFLIYRRTRKEMPACPEEVEAALSEGITLKELTTPVRIEQEGEYLKLICTKMKLGEPDESGRQRPVPIEDSQFALHFDRILYAIGQQVEFDFLDNQDATNLKKNNIFIGGDALHGPRNLIFAIADGRKAAIKIMEMADYPAPEINGRISPQSIASLYEKTARREYGSEPDELPPGQRRNFKPYREILPEEEAIKEASRCLSCDQLCNVCVSVCPNRANISYRVEPVEYSLQKAVKQGERVVIQDDRLFKVEQEYQVLNIADSCNECGNCRTFCPTAGSPYKDKPRICLIKESFALEDGVYFIGSDKVKSYIKSKFNGKEATLSLEDNEFLYRTEGVAARLDKKSFIIKKIEFTSPRIKKTDFRHAAEMSILLKHCPPHLFPD
ncbi:FAD-dependent oxidoreductase [Acidobacteriota bacterium]